MSIEQDVKAGQIDLRNLSGLVSDAMAQFAKLFQNELDLAKAELSEKFRALGGAMGLIAGGVVLIIPALVMVLFALSSALIAEGWSQPLSYLISAILAGVISGILFAVGMSRLDAGKLTPHETIRQLEKDKDTAKGMVR